MVDKLAALVRLFHDRHGRGRAIAAPQIGLMKRLVVLNIDHPIPLFNPVLTYEDSATFELWDDCMSFPNLLVRVRRFRTAYLTYRNMQWEECNWTLTDDLAELLQHECDHLDGVLATQRAIDDKSFRWKN